MYEILSLVPPVQPSSSSSVQFLILLLAHGLRKRPKEFKSLKGKVVAHKFITKKATDIKEKK